MSKLTAITEADAIQRIRESLPDDEDIRVVGAASKEAADLGGCYQHLRGNVVVNTHATLEDFAEEVGVLGEHEFIDVEG